MTMFINAASMHSSNGFNEVELSLKNEIETGSIVRVSPILTIYNYATREKKATFPP
jgi:hypothetical protein